jgi:hypothetical protein
MSEGNWKAAEKKLARRVFESALQTELAEVMAKFKELAANAEIPDDMWAIQDYLARAQREIDRKYDFRYSQLEVVFGLLMREKRIEEQDLNGLGEEKLSTIRRIAGA